MALDRIVLDLENVKLNTWSTAASNEIQGLQRGRLFQALQRIFLVLLAGMTVFLFLQTFTYSDTRMSLRELPPTALEHQNNFKGNETLAEYLEREVRVLCWILTSPKNHKTRAIHVKKTWGRRCTKLLFVTTKEDDELDTLVIDIEEKYENLWGKTRKAFKHLYEQHLDEYDWFMKADDDTYVFMENLRYMLYSYMPETPIFFGFNFKLGGRKRSYMSGGSGYTLSREALRRFGSISLNSPSGCKLDDNTGAEDAEMGICLSTANVSAGDSRDAVLKQRYDIFNPDGALMANLWPKDFWYQKQSFYHAHLSQDALSEYAIAFHYVSPEDMYMYEYLKYEFEVFGLDRPKESLPKKLRADEVVIPDSDNDWE